nr:RNA-directed DNA polymerase, eukaryota [Tanacetum cinerariifolium]
MLWIEISGLPLCAWGSNAFKKVACLFGKFMFFEAEDSTAMSSSRVCISTRSHNLISEKFSVEVHGETFDVNVHELGTWSISISDSSLDTSYNIDVNDRDKLADYVEENLFADLNYLNDNIKYLVQNTKEDEIQVDDINATGLDQAQLKEEVKALIPSTIGGSSDLSRPPGFKHMKKDSFLYK